jgi:hypothetical protein
LQLLRPRGRGRGGAFRRRLRWPDLPRIRHPLRRPGSCLPQPRAHVPTEMMAAQPLLRRNGTMAAVRHPRRRLPAGHWSLRGRPLPRRAREDRPDRTGWRGALAY